MICVTFCSRGNHHKKSFRFEPIKIIALQKHRPRFFFPKNNDNPLTKHFRVFVILFVWKGWKYRLISIRKCSVIWEIHDTIIDFSAMEKIIKCQCSAYVKPFWNEATLKRTGNFSVDYTNNEKALLIKWMNPQKINSNI